MTEENFRLVQKIKITKVLSRNSVYVKELGVVEGDTLHIIMNVRNCSGGRGNYARYIDILNLSNRKTKNYVSLNTFYERLDVLFEYEQLL